MWLTEMVCGSLAGPFLGMAYALALTSCLKLGTGMAVLPERHRVLVARASPRPWPGLAPAGYCRCVRLKPAHLQRSRSQRAKVVKCCLRQCKGVLNSDSQVRLPMVLPSSSQRPCLS